jgi:uncharacterized protein (DUF736 family)
LTAWFTLTQPPKLNKGDAMALVDRGAVWVKTDKKGNDMLSIVIQDDDGGKQSFLAFMNSYKTDGDNKPHFKVYEVVDDPGKEPF